MEPLEVDLYGASEIQPNTSDIELDADVDCTFDLFFFKEIRAVELGDPLRKSIQIQLSRISISVWSKRILCIQLTECLIMEWKLIYFLVERRNWYCTKSNQPNNHSSAHTDAIIQFRSKLVGGKQSLCGTGRTQIVWLNVNLEQQQREPWIKKKLS